MKLIKKFLYDTSLPTVSKVVGVSTAVGCLPGAYMCINSNTFELVSNYFWVNKAFNSLSFGIFLIVPICLFLVGLIPSRVLRYGFGFANAYQLKLFNFLYAVNAYADVIKSTPYFEVLYKYSVEEKFTVLKALNIKQAYLSSVPQLSEEVLKQIAIDCTTMAEVKACFNKSFNLYYTAITQKLEEHSTVEASWIPAFKVFCSSALDWAPYIIGIAVVAIIGYKVNNFFNAPLEAIMYGSDGIRMQQRLDCLSGHVSDLAAEHARLAEIVRNAHNNVTSAVIQNTTISQGVASLSESMLTHSQLLDGVIRVLVNNPEFLATARRLQGVENFSRISS